MPDYVDISIDRYISIDYPSMRFHIQIISEDSSLGISLIGFSVRVHLVVVSQEGCCGCSQYNLFDWMLWLHVNATLNQIYVILLTISLYLGLHDIAEWGSVFPICPFLAQWFMVGVIYPIVFVFLFRLLLFKVFPFDACNLQQNIFSYIFTWTVSCSSLGFFPFHALISHFYYCCYYFYYYFCYTYYYSYCY